MPLTLPQHIGVGKTLYTAEGYLPGPSENDGMDMESCLESTRLPRHFSGKGGYTASAQQQDTVCSFFSIGTPVVFPLDQLLREQNETIPAAIRLQMPAYHFYYVHMACSFQASPGYQLTSAQFGVQLLTEPANHDNQSGNPEHAIAYAMYPFKEEDEFSRVTTLNLLPSLQFTCSPLDVTLALPSCEQTNSGSVSHSRITAYNIQSERPSRHFLPTPAHDIDGAYKLSLIVRKPHTTHVRAIFHLEAQARSERGGPLRSLLLLKRSRSGATLTEHPAYPLC